MNDKAAKAERFRKRLAATIKVAVGEGIAASELNVHHVCIPPPADLDAEQDLCAAILHGVPPSSLDLVATDFYAPLFREVFTAAFLLERHKLIPTPARVAKAMIDGGAIGPVEEELFRIVDFTPYYHVKRIYQRAERLRELRRRRDLLRLMGRLDAALRTDGVTHEKALEVLKRYGAK